MALPHTRRNPPHGSARCAHTHIGWRTPRSPAHGAARTPRLCQSHWPHIWDIWDHRRAAVHGPARRHAGTRAHTHTHTSGAPDDDAPRAHVSAGGRRCHVQRPRRRAFGRAGDRCSGLRVLVCAGLARHVLRALTTDRAGRTCKCPAPRVNSMQRSGIDVCSAMCGAPPYHHTAAANYDTPRPGLARGDAEAAPPT